MSSPSPPAPPHDDSSPGWLARWREKGRAWRSQIGVGGFFLIAALTLFGVAGGLNDLLESKREALADRLQKLDRISLAELIEVANGKDAVVITRHTDWRPGAVAGGAMLEVAAVDQERRVLELTPGLGLDDEIGKLAANAKNLRIESKDVPGPSPGVVSGLNFLGVIALFVALIVFLPQIQGQALSGRRFETKTPDGGGLDDIIGYDELKQEVRSTLERLKAARDGAKDGVDAPKGFLLTGDPGVGKTLVARSMATESGMTLLLAGGSDFVEMYVGVGAKRVRGLFADARRAVKAGKAVLIFVDEIDAIGARGDRNTDSERLSVINALLAEMDGITGNEHILVVGATNNPERLDAALRRPGRFDKTIHVPLPDRSTREKILAHYLRGDAEGVDVAALARRTTGLAGAHLRTLVNEARIIGRRRDDGGVRAEDLDQAVEQLAVGFGRIKAGPDEIRRVAVHEIGHALAGRLHALGSRVEKITVAGRGRALGYAEITDDNEHALMTETQMRARLRFLLGGRAAEQAVLGEVSSGAADDLNQAGRLAGQMVSGLGLGVRCGLAVDVQGSAAARDIRDILDDEYRVVLAGMTEHADWIAAAADRLQLAETLTGEELFSDFERRLGGG